MEGDVGRYGLGPEGTGIFLFVQEFDFAHPHAIVVEEELLGIIDGMTEFYFLADVGCRNLIDGALEADGGVVIDHPFMTDEEDLVQFGLG